MYADRTIAKPSMSTCRRARSREASSCWFGDVEVCVRKASSKGSATSRLKSWSRTWIIDDCRSADSDLCVECVAYTRTRAFCGSGSSRRFSHSLRGTPSIDSFQSRYCSAYSALLSFSSRRWAVTIAVRCRIHGTAAAYANHASSHRKQMSGLIASTSSMTRIGL